LQDLRFKERFNFNERGDDITLIKSFFGTEASLKSSGYVKKVYIARESNLFRRNINEIDLDGWAVLHSFVTLNYKLESTYPCLKSSLHMILQDAQKLAFQHGFADETSIHMVNNPAAALRPCFMKYEDRVFRKCDF
jgi:hypothetical protein